MNIFSFAISSLFYRETVILSSHFCSGCFVRAACSIICNAQKADGTSCEAPSAFFRFIYFCVSFFRRSSIAAAPSRHTTLMPSHSTGLSPSPVCTLP